MLTKGRQPKDKEHTHYTGVSISQGSNLNDEQSVFLLGNSKFPLEIVLDQIALSPPLPLKMSFQVCNFFR